MTFEITIVTRTKKGFKSNSIEIYHSEIEMIKRYNYLNIGDLVGEFYHIESVSVKKILRFKNKDSVNTQYY